MFDSARADHDFRYDLDAHRAWLGDEELPSVTRILKAAGIIDASHYTVEARDRGTRFHRATEAYDNGEIAGPDAFIDFEEPARHHPIIANKLGVYQTFLVEQDVEILALEQVVYCPVWKYWGIFDRVVRLRRLGFEALLDFKPNPAPWHRLQLGAYARLTGHTRKGALYVREDGYKWVPFHDRPQDAADFLRARKQVGDTWRTAA